MLFWKSFNISKDIGRSVATKSLSANEKLVLYGLVRYPALNDRELAEKLDINQWTVNKIRNRLRISDMYRTIRIPFLQHLGAELFGVFYGRFPSFTRIETTLNPLNKIQLGFEEIIYAASELNQGFAFGIAEDYTSIMENMYKFNIICQEQRFGDSNINNALFSFHLLDVFRFFEYAPLLRHTFGLEIDGKEQDMLLFHPTKITEYHLNDLEKKLYYNLVKYTETSDKALSERINVTRQFVTKTRKRFEKDNILKTVRIPNLKKLGFEVLALGHIKFRLDVTLTDLKEHPGTMKYGNNIVLALMEKSESVFMGAFKSFSDAKNAVSQITEDKDVRKYFLAEPDVLMLSIPNLTVWRDHNFESVTGDIIGI